MKTMITIDRWLLGLIFVVFGLNGFFPVIPIPELEPSGRQFMDILIESGMIYSIKAFEVLGGLLVLNRRTTPLGLVLLGPIVVGIVLFHLFLAPATITLALIASVVWAVLIWHDRERFRGLFLPASSEATPGS